MLSELVFLLFCKMNAVTLHCQFSISNVVLPSGVPHSNLFHFLAAKRATRKKIRLFRWHYTFSRALGVFFVLFWFNADAGRRVSKNHEKIQRLC